VTLWHSRRRSEVLLNDADWVILPRRLHIRSLIRRRRLEWAPCVATAILFSAVMGTSESHGDRKRV